MGSELGLPDNQGKPLWNFIVGVCCKFLVLKSGAGCVTTQRYEGVLDDTRHALADPISGPGDSSSSSASSNTWAPSTLHLRGKGAQYSPPVH